MSCPPPRRAWRRRPGCRRRNRRGRGSFRSRSFGGHGVLIEEAIAGARQAEIVAQCLALVVLPVDAAALKLRNQFGAEIVERTRQVWELNGEAVGGVGGQP